MGSGRDGWSHGNFTVTDLLGRKCAADIRQEQWNGDSKIVEGYEH